MTGADRDVEVAGDLGDTDVAAFDEVLERTQRVGGGAQHDGIPGGAPRRGAGDRVHDRGTLAVAAPPAEPRPSPRLTPIDPPSLR